jgi:creatinine amidohydrolase
MKMLIVVCICFLVASSALSAQTPDTVFMEELTWTEVRDAIKAGKTTIIFPTGGTEQNGPHMVLGKHNFIVKHTAEQIARRLGNALVAPVLAYVPEGNIDPPTGHMQYPGTITLPDEFFIKVAEYAARSFRVNGFKDIVLMVIVDPIRKACSPSRACSTRNGRVRLCVCTSYPTITMRTASVHGCKARGRNPRTSAPTQASPIPRN